MENVCVHKKLRCLNPYEYIRKYLCLDCHEVMMCECDRFVGETFLSHQLYEGAELHTQKRFPVTQGFQQVICDSCRGNPIEATPVAKIYGRTSKILRYYWREIFFETCKRYHSETGDTDIPHKFQDRYEQIEAEVIENLKALHLTNPKYKYTEVSDNEIINQYAIEVIKVKAVHVRTDNKKVRIKSGNILKTVEDFAIDYFRNLGAEVIVCESRPFHVLFGTLMWLVIQDYRDPLNRIVGFGRRSQEKGKAEIIWTQLPEDFGTSGYYERRLADITAHIESLEDVYWLFEYWLGPSADLRQYLWAHGESDVATAKLLLSKFSLEELKKILWVLTKNYWHNFCGWPDLLVTKGDEKYFVEVKSSNDKLSEDQKHWISINNSELKFGFKIFKVTKANLSD